MTSSPLPPSQPPHPAGPNGPAPTAPVGFAQALRFWFWLGCVSFGGPAGQVALMHQELVVRRRWLSERRYLHALNYCMLLPGPEAQQLATYIGWLMHGTRGGVAAGVLFVLPSLLLLVALSWAYVSWGQHPWGQALLWGLKPAVVALVLQAVQRMAKRTLHARWLWALAGASLLGTAAGVPFAALVLAAAGVGWVAARHAPTDATAANAAHTPTHTPTHTAAAQPSAPPAGSASAWLDDHTPAPAHTRYRPRSAAVALAVGLALWAVPLGGMALWLGLGHTLTQMGGLFTQAALLTFGGAYAVLPFVTHAAVAQHGWLSAAQMMDGLAFGESTPGPLIMVVAFVGFLAGHGQALTGTPWLGGAVAACVATWFTFLPSFVFILVGGPWVESTRQMPALTVPLQAIGAAVIGVMVHLAGTFALHTWLPGGWPAQALAAQTLTALWPIDLWALALTGLAAWLLVVRQRSAVQVLALCVGAGLALHAGRGWGV